MFKYIKIMFFYRKELDELIEKQRQDFRRIEIETKKHNLDLCKKHQQRKGGSHYSEKNCNYCQLLEKIKSLES